ncbi:unnamed protein product, partial [Rotaria sp. Silwood1]
IDSCNYSSTNEYSIENTLQAQKWLYEHQHPMNCTNRKFAIIQNFAWSGFGSTIHQIAWAFATRNVIFASFNRMTKQQRGKIVLEFLTDLFIEANADLHVGTLTSNWCRLIDGMRLVLGKIIPYYTPENRYLMNTRRRR